MFIAGLITGAVITTALILVIACAVVSKWEDDNNEC